jgi:trk system potassium uptake protein TrkA
MKSIAVIGLSSFGFYLCQYLKQRGVNILAIDKDEESLNKVRPFVKKAIVADARNKDVLKKFGLEDFDEVVISVGEHIDVSILIVLHLRELGVKEIVAKAVNEEHAKILHMIGASTIVFPERDMAKRMAYTMHRSNLLDYVPLGEEYSIIEIAPPRQWTGKSLHELNVRAAYRIQIIMVKEIVPQNTLLIPDGNYVVKDSDILVLLGENADLERVEKL